MTDDPVPRARLAKASVFVDDDTGAAWAVAETPSEVEALVAQPRASGMVQLTLANKSHDWNGRTLFVRADRVSAVSPPMDQDDDEDDE